MVDNQVTHESLLLKWADCLQIPSGTFVNDDLRDAAAEISRLRREKAELVGALKEAERYLEYLGGETAGTFVGRGMPADALAQARAALRSATETKGEPNV